jgi:hypothetical protein
MSRFGNYCIKKSTNIQDKNFQKAKKNAIFPQCDKKCENL